MSQAVNILLVDDEQRNLEALAAILDDPGYELHRVDHAEAALRVLLKHEVAVVILDVHMPQVDGFELARLIRGTKKFRETPILFLTAHLFDTKDVLAGYDAGGADYLVKPVNPRILRQKVAIFADLFRKTRDLADLNQHLEARVRERTEELRAAGRQKDQFLATLAHELRNPLAPLRIGLDLLLREPNPSGNAVRTLNAMNRQLSHMVRLIDDLLDVSRISRGTLEMRSEDVDVASILEHAVETAQQIALRQQQSVEVDAASELPTTGDATRISQVITNLLNNALKHSPRGGVIRVEARRVGTDAVLSVRDDGVGIPGDQLEHVFEMFTKIARSGEAPSDGLGIGLALSRRLAQLHGGTLSAASEGEGRGATFTLTLPLTAGRRSDPAQEAVGEAASSSAPTAPDRSLAVVVIEDNEDSADLMEVWLIRLGHAVQIARTGPDGLALVTESRPDVVLCDIGLPGMDGVEVCRHVLTEMRSPPVMVALTGWGMLEDRARTATAGFQHHLVKPVAMEQLIEVLRQVPPRST
jgi:signal transduction histidine kinase